MHFNKGGLNIETRTTSNIIAIESILFLTERRISLSSRRFQPTSPLETSMPRYEYYIEFRFCPNDRYIHIYIYLPSLEIRYTSYIAIIAIESVNIPVNRRNLTGNTAS